MAGNPDFDLYTISEEHEALREAIRPVCENKIAPHAADVDEESRFPSEALDALVEAGLAAPHVPEEYGGAGIDALGTCIVIEEVARVCASDPRSVVDLGCGLDRLVDDVDLGLAYADLTWGEGDTAELSSLFDQLEFRVLRDGQVITEDDGTTTTIPGLFDEAVFDQSIQASSTCGFTSPSK